MVTSGLVSCEDNHHCFAGEPLLLLAVLARNNELVDLLIEHKADVNAANEEQATALMYACKFGDEQAVQALVKANASQVLQHCSGSTALMFAAKEGHVQIMELLIKSGYARQHAMLCGIMWCATIPSLDS